MVVDYDKLTAAEKLELKLEAFERAKTIMRACLRRDGVQFLRDEFASLSSEEALRKEAEFIADSEWEDSDGIYSRREVDDLISGEKDDPAKRQALLELCVLLSEESELTKELHEWLIDYTRRTSPRSVGRGKGQRRIYQAEIYTEVIGLAIALAERDDLVKEARLWPTRYEEYGKVSNREEEKRKSASKKNKLSLCDAMMEVLEEFGESRSYAYVEDKWKTFNRELRSCSPGDNIS